MDNNLAWQLRCLKVGLTGLALTGSKNEMKSGVRRLCKEKKITKEDIDEELELTEEVIRHLTQDKKAVAQVFRHLLNENVQVETLETQEENGNMDVNMEDDQEEEQNNNNTTSDNTNRGEDEGSSSGTNGTLPQNMVPSNATQDRTNM